MGIFEKMGENARNTIDNYNQKQRIKIQKMKKGEQ